MTREAAVTHPLLQPKPMSLDDFDDLLADEPEDERWELICGRVVCMMVGARWEHHRICNNIGDGMDRRLRALGSPCRSLRATFRIKEGSSLSSLLPDVLVYCTRPPAGATFLEDATVVVEVLSPGTQRRDREEKWFAYQRLPSLQQYVLVSRDAPYVQRIDREDGSWSGFRVIEGLEAELALPALGIALPMREVYADVLG